MTTPRTSPRALLERVYAAAVAAADPESATHRAVTEASTRSRATRVISVGKAAGGMAAGALTALTEKNVAAKGIVVSGGSRRNLPDSFEQLEGDHPIPGPRSRAASDAISKLIAHGDQLDDALVLVSGGTTSLIADPIDGVSATDLVALFEALLSSGADIVTMNALRKRVLRWGAGRLAAALHPARTRCLIVSDVIGNDLGAIGSGPCVPDPTTAQALLEMVNDRSLSASLPASVLTYLHRVRRGDLPETSKPTDSVFASVETQVIVDGRDAVTGAARAASALTEVAIHSEAITGDAAVAGTAVAQRLLDVRRSTSVPSVVHIWWGETTVQLPPRAPSGGRCQELALACAEVLHRAGTARGITVLAAGSDGRDGPTDAAGAVVDGATWSRIAAAGRDPAMDLAQHASYDALDAAGALFRTGPTGTNVNDLVLGLVEA